MSIEKPSVKPNENVQALRLIEQWLSEAPKDPEKLKEAEADLLTFKQAINQTRKSAGARIRYPEAE